ncbi:hypothetical protein DPMN_102706 [Dreissena polymorpha]|uniref:G-protein coupled receptors family 1 profile domain-containing protein n=1 Tax=Dreissena polymorpha TaxID=45954 RepID=A0A9D4LKV4_DREPO|nr:hypothetical protein DPMN_102706 [Dreissena polymorpha]
MENVTNNIPKNSTKYVLTCVATERGNATCDLLSEEIRTAAMDVNVYPIICAVAYVILGFVGNSVVIFIYLTKWKKNRTRVFILCLGILDWLNCTFSVPIEIGILWYPMSFDHNILCKISRGLTFVINNTGALVLVSIAIERFLVVYYPLKCRQLTPRFSKILCLSSFVIASAVVWPSFVFYGTNTITIPVPQYNARVIGKTCLIADEHEIRKGLILIFTTVLFALLILVFIVLSTLYIAIGRKIYFAAYRDVGYDGENSVRMMRRSLVSAITGVTSVGTLRRVSSMSQDSGSFRRTESFDRSCDLETTTKIKSTNSGSSRIDSVPEESVSVTSNHASELEISANPSANKTARTYSQSDLNANTPTTIQKRPLLRRSFSTVKHNATRKNTIMMRMVTIAFMLSYTPFLIILMIRYTHGTDSFKYYLSLGKAGKIAYKVFLNSYFINSMINPYIYGFMNVQFRKQVNILFRNIFCIFKGPVNRPSN